MFLTCPLSNSYDPASLETTVAELIVSFPTLSFPILLSMGPISLPGEMKQLET